MNPLRAFVRDVVSLASSEAVKAPNELGLRRALEQRVVPPVVDLGRFRDSFEGTEHRASSTAAPTLRKAPVKASWSSLSLDSNRFSSSFHSNLDGFEAPRRARVNLFGETASVPATKLPRRSNGFTASLHDLG